MVRIKYTGSMAQVQQVPVQTKTQAESEETTRLKTQEDLTVKQQQSLEMVQIMLHVSVSSLTASLFLVDQTLTSTLSLVRHVILSSVCKPQPHFQREGQV